MAAATDLPAFEVTVGGAKLEPLVAADVIELDVHEEVNRHGRLTVLIHNWDPDQRKVRYSDDGPFAPGAGIAVALGYHSDLANVFDGVICSLTAQFPQGGAPVLRIEARSRSILMEHPPRSRQLAESSDADLANAIAADYSLTADAADGVTRPAVVSDRVSDWDVLKARARELGWVTYVRGDSLVLRPPSTAEPELELVYTQSLVELHLTQDITRAVDSVVGTGWDTAALEATESEEGAAAADVKLGDRAAHDTAVSDAGWPLRTERAESPAVPASDAADAIAVGRQRRAALAHYSGTGVTHGNAAIRCDQWLTVTGVGTRLSGPHYVSAARHRLSTSGYRTEFQVGVPPRLAPAAESVARGGPLVLATVESLDDPDSANRVRVRLPWRKDDGEGVWARVATLDAGDGFGTVFVPNTGQEVLVGFVDGAADHPVVLGSLHNGTQPPPITIDPDKNAIRAIVTPGGHTITLDDDSPKITLETSNGNSVVINDDDSKIVLTHSSANAVTLSDDGIELNAAKGDIVLKAASGAVKIDAKSIEGKASGPSKLESSATFDLTASGPLGLKGALVKIN